MGSRRDLLQAVFDPRAPIIRRQIACSYLGWQRCAFLLVHRTVNSGASPSFPCLRDTDNLLREDSRLSLPYSEMH